MVVIVIPVDLEIAAEIAERTDCRFCRDIVEEARNEYKPLYHARGTTSGCYFEHIYDDLEEAQETARLQNELTAGHEAGKAGRKP